MMRLKPAQLPLIFTLIALTCLPSRAPAAPVIELTPEEQAWLEERPVVRLAVNHQFPPRAFLDKDGVLKGIGVDFARLFEQKLGLKVALIGSSWKTALDRAFKYEVDGIMNVAALEERMRYLNFTKVYLSSPQAVPANEREPLISGLDALCANLPNDSNSSV